MSMSNWQNIFFQTHRVITFLNHAVPDFTDNCGNNIIRYGNDFYATSETNYIRKIDPVTLETLGKVADTLNSDLPHYTQFLFVAFTNFQTLTCF